MSAASAGGTRRSPSASSLGARMSVRCRIAGGLGLLDGSRPTCCGRRVAYRIGMAGRHVALNSLAVLAAAHALGLDIDRAAAAYAELLPPVGPG